MNDHDKEIRADVLFKGDLITKEDTKQLKGAGDSYRRCFGVCAKCGNLDSFETEYGSYYARCGYFMRTLNHADPVRHCTSFWDISYTKLKDLIPMATLIDTKAKIGFVTGEDYI